MAEETKILQVIPADGWSAQYEEEDDIPLVCFALVQDIDEAGAMKIGRASCRERV